MSVASSTSEYLEQLLGLLFEYAYGEEFVGTPYSASMLALLPKIAKSVAGLSRLYTRERNRLSKGILNEIELRRAYLIYFLPSSLFKLKGILGEIWRHPMREELLSPNLRVLDLGSGPATNSLCFLDLVQEAAPFFQSLECVTVDRQSVNLQYARSIFSRRLASVQDNGECIPCQHRTQQADLTRLSDLNADGVFDFVILGNVVNELFLDEPDRLKRRCSLLTSLVSRWLGPRGFLILLEPALRDTSRDLLHLRDLLLASTDLKVYSPCVHSLPCPALHSGNGTDWCHEDRAWPSHDILRRIDALVGNRKNSLKFSYVVLNRTGISIREAMTSIVDLPPGHQAKSRTAPFQGEIWRAVSERLEEKGRSSAFICGSSGRWRITRLDKHASPANHAFCTIQRGQLLITLGLKCRNSSEMRVESDTQLTRLLDPPVEIAVKWASP